MRLEEAPDALLAQRSADGDDRAFAVLVRRYAPALRGFASRYLGSTLEADDVVQEALVNAWRRMGELRDPAQVRSWLMASVARRATDVIRTRARRRTDGGIEEREIEDGRDGPERTLERREATRALGRAVEALPEEQRDVWILRQLAGLSYEEIAARTGSTPATVRGRLARARQSVLATMEQWR
ncbi:RNA polymerase sigma factor [Agrococcus jejuensis]|uniref:RNA polymerase, sigma subunit, ECF family n=1 Tax=Agrococcus jejuensis TaxID=399736 RepID=A0A1G8DPT2_9MICO|nr:sigma-70 family RNA polymerase sigma factor [Agrococcus jejuensis]SDH59704.1 RNA polymerase, sigma subunit, ECF family [Agrococcus jejuensis]